MSSNSHLILGGARSGKSRFAEQQATQHAQPVYYIATACQIDHDPAWQQRIEHHRSRRPDHWQTIEAPHTLPAAIHAAATPDALLLVDCLTLWLSNIMLANLDVAQQQAALCQAIASIPCDIILVSNEVGSGIVPEHPLGRSFRDHQGRLNQAVAATCNRVDCIIAGLPLRLKG